MEGYKLLTENLKAPFNSSFSYQDWQNQEYGLQGYDGLEMCVRGFHLSKSLNKVYFGEGGTRVFLAETIGKFIEDENKICAEGIRLLKELSIFSITDSCWAYYYCRDVKDRPEVRANVSDSCWAYRYCRDVKDRPEIRAKITNAEKESMKQLSSET